MMDTVGRIKDHILALNSVRYDDEPALESFLSDVKSTIFSCFSDRSHYMTFLGSTCYHPVATIVPKAEAILGWARTKKQLRELLLVMLADAQGRPAYRSRDDLARHGSLNELEEAERIVSRHIGGGQAVAALPRVRIDLRDINILNAEVESYLLREDGGSDQLKNGPILFFAGRDEGLNKTLCDRLEHVEAEIVQIPWLFHSGRAIQEQYALHADVRMAVVALGEDCWLSLQGRNNPADVSSPSPGVCFGLGYLAGCLGRGRLAVFYRETPAFRRPTDFFELFYVPVDNSRAWESELAARLKQNNITVRSAGGL
ncbi:MAG: hypothetical protein HQL20_02820 [Candidatus Omnitrophica bacterium]|nr:hypothetical protein [Candidatus Omnitrophota bacterium]